MRALRRRLEGVLDRPGALSNPGLALSRYVPAIAGDDPDRRATFKKIADAPLSPLYRKAFDRWKARLDALDSVKTEPWRVGGRLIVGLGAETVHETGITLLQPYGVPCIPGTALKGLARRYAEHEVFPEAAERLRQRAARTSEHRQQAEQHELSTEEQQFLALFGAVEEAAHLVWLDAWYIPGSAPRDRPLALDTITVHHPDWYQSGGSRTEDGRVLLPTDFDDPTPVAFLSARGAWLLAVRGPTSEWADAAMKLLKQALDTWGVGGKTSSGYGRPAGEGGAAARPTAATRPRVAPAPRPASPPPARAERPPAPPARPPALAPRAVAPEPAPPPPAPAAPTADAIIARVEALTPALVQSQAGSLWARSSELSEPERRRVAEAIRAKLQRNKLTAWAVGRVWYDELVALLERGA